MAYHPEQWYKIGGTYITPNDDVGIKLTSDVYINFGDLYGSPGYGLRDDSGTMQFKNDGGAWSNLGSGTGGGASALSDLTDVDASVASPSDGDIMVYRSSGNDWVLESKPAGGSNPAIADITDVTITSVSDDEVLAYDTTSGEFINQTAAEAGLAAASHNHTASEISDFDTEVSNNTDVAANTSDRHSAATVTDTPTVDLTISGQDIQGDVISQMSVTSDASGIKLESDEVSPGNNKVYGTDGTGNKGWQDGGGGGNTYFNNESIDQSGGTSDTHGVLSGTLDGTNTTFTVSSGAYTTGTLSVYLNGQLLTQGSSEDWTETTPASGTFDFVTAPQSSDEITVAYQENELSSESVITDATTNVSATSWVLDEDTLVSDSDTKVPTQQSVKAYVDANSGGGGGGITWNEVTGTTQAASVNAGYIANNAGLVTITLPTTAAVGDVVRVTGKGAGGWLIAQNASQIIHFLGTDTTTGTGGSLASTGTYDGVEIVCVVANTEWVVISSMGNITIV